MEASFPQPASEVASTLMVGIPAYNEAGNIGRLLREVLRQSVDGFRLERVVVISDGSTDLTGEVVRHIDDFQVELLLEAERLGKAARLTQLMRLCRSDVLICLDADVSVPDVELLARLARPILLEGADLVACGLSAHSPSTLLERVLAAGLSLRNCAAELCRHGDNVYTCHGPALAYSRRMYQSCALPPCVGEDAYAYLYAKQHELTYRFVPEASVQIKLPDTLNDHWRQSARFRQNRAALSQYFPAETVRQAFALPLPTCLWALGRSLTSHPGSTLAYLAILGLTLLTTSTLPSEEYAWGPALTTKVQR